MCRSRSTAGRRCVHGGPLLWVLLVALVVFLAQPGGRPASRSARGASATGSGATISVLNVEVLPEHDDPRVLVIYRGQLNAAAPLPYTLTFAIPPSGQVNAAAYRGADGQLLSTEYQYRQNGDRLDVAVTVPERGFQFEYYADLITGQRQRVFTASLVFPLPVDVMRVSVEQPARSSAFGLIPVAGGTATAGTGLTRHLYTVTRWPAGKPWSVRVTYQKPDSTPSLPRVVRTPEAPRAGPGRGMPVWGWIAAILAALGVATLAVYGLVRRRDRSGGKPAPGVSARSQRAVRGADARRSGYCANCGAQARRGDRFCSRCGRPLHRE